MSNKDDIEVDKQLVAGARRGDRDSLSALIDRHKDSILSLLVRQVGNHSLAEDLTQDVFVRAYSNLSSFQGRSQFRTWLIRIALNVAHSHFESRAAKNERRTTMFDARVHERFMSSSLDSVSLDDRHFVRHLLMTLDRKFREAIVLVLVEGWTHSEAAEILEIPQGTVASRVRMGLEILKKNFARRTV